MQCFPTARVEQTLALGQMIGRPSVAEIANSGAEQRRPAADMEERFGERVWGRYGFCDAFNPTEDWTDDDFIAIDQGITLLSAENPRTGNVWRWFMRNPEIRRAMYLARFAPAWM